VITTHSITRHREGPRQPAGITISPSNGRHRVVIVGSGFGGLAAAKALRRAPVDVTVIDRTNHHLFQPLLYQMATAIVGAGDIASPIRDILRRHSNTRVLLGDVVDVALDVRDVTLEAVGRSTRVAYDTLIVAAGAGQSYFGHDEFGVHAPGLKTIDDALEVPGRTFGAFELAELEHEESQRDAWLTIAVVGAGPTGVEVAGQIAELSGRALKRNFRTFDPAQTRVILLDAVDTVLPTFPESLRRHRRPAMVDGAGGGRAKQDAARSIRTDPRADQGALSVHRCRRAS
jgi:NADH:ubiquinone reductase (H+-translocating)